MEKTDKLTTKHPMFNEIRPYTDEECRSVINKLMKSHQVFDVLARFVFPSLYKIAPGLVRSACKLYAHYKTRNIKTLHDFHVHLVNWFFFSMITKTSTGFSTEWNGRPQKDKGYLLISNHRDIVLDPAIVAYSFFKQNVPTSLCGFGDNLIRNEYATDLIRLNRGFIVKRSISSPKALYREMKLLSTFIHTAIGENQSVWLAQRKGRAKDSRDKTDPVVLKMLALAGDKKRPAKILNSLNIRPVSISCQYDPCDIYKAYEVAKTQSPGSISLESAKNRNITKDPLAQMSMSINGHKGRIHAEIGKIMAFDPDASMEEIITDLDAQIIGNYKLYDSNFYSLKRLIDMKEEHPDTLEQAMRLFDAKSCQCPYLEKRIDTYVDNDWLIPYLRIYANPILEKLNLPNTKNGCA